MRKRKGNLLQRTMASLLSAVLITGMALDAVPLTVLAQENGGGITRQRKQQKRNPGRKKAYRDPKKARRNLTEKKPQQILW
jgi:hypothetical protein